MLDDIPAIFLRHDPAYRRGAFDLTVGALHEAPVLALSISGCGRDENGRTLVLPIIIHHTEKN